MRTDGKNINESEALENNIPGGKLFCLIIGILIVLVFVYFAAGGTAAYVTAVAMIIGLFVLFGYLKK